MMIKKVLTLIPSAYNHKAMGDIVNFIPHYKDKLKIVVISDLYDEDLIEIDDVQYVKAKTSLSDYYVYTSDYIIDAGAVNRHSKVWPKQKRISVWHGIPYKNMFIDLDEKYISSALNYQRSYDFMISPSSYYTESFLKSSMLYNGKVLEVGSSRCDSLFNNNRNSIFESLDIDESKKIILYAPTFREPGVFNVPFDIDFILDRFGQEYLFLIKGHYLNTIKSNSKNFVDVSSYNNINELLAISDVVITDYSSLFFDYSIVNKNVIFFQYDKVNYLDDRGVMFDLKKYVDIRLICENEEDLVLAAELIKSGEPFKNTLKENFYPYADGNDTKRIVESLKLDSQERTHKDIIFLVNDLNNIGGVHTFVSTLSKLFKNSYLCKIILISIREFNDNYNEFKLFNDENIDILLSLEKQGGAVRNILKNTDGYIISTQFSVHKKLQDFLFNKNVALMFHGDVKDVINRSLYQWHYDALIDGSIYNYKKLLLLSESNSTLMKSEGVSRLDKRVDYVYNPYYSSGKNSYQDSGVFVAITRLDNDKNIFDLLDIFSHKDINPNFKLEVYGDGALYSEFKSEIINRKLENKVFLMGYESCKSVIFNNKQGLIFTPISEGFPYVILEAFDYGVPVYTYDSFTAVKDMINDNVGKIVNYKDIDGYVSVLNSKFEVEYDKFTAHLMRFSPDLTLNKWDYIFESCDSESSVLQCDVKEKFDFKLVLKKKIKLFYKKLSKKNKVFVRSWYSQLIECYILFSKLKEKPLVSIVMPFYNNHATLEDAIKSVYKQRYENFEILLINDGSKEVDRSILDKYSKVKYFYKENEGLGLTRNFGLDNSHGKYVFFLDSDDTIPSSSLTLLVSFAEKNNLPLVMGKKSRINFHDKNERHVWMPAVYKKNYINTRSDRNKLLMETTSTGYLYRLSDIKKYNLKFDTGLYEDKIYMVKAYNALDNIGILNHFTYNWLIYGNNTSITTSINFNNFKERYDRLWEIWLSLDDKGRFIYYHQVISHDFKIYINNYLLIDESDRFRVFELMSCFLIENKIFFYPKNIVNIINLEIVDSIFNRDFARFDKISSIFSNHYLDINS